MKLTNFKKQQQTNKQRRSRHSHQCETSRRTMQRNLTLLEWKRSIYIRMLLLQYLHKSKWRVEKQKQKQMNRSVLLSWMRLSSDSYISSITSMSVISTLSSKTRNNQRIQYKAVCRQGQWRDHRRLRCRSTWHDSLPIRLVTVGDVCYNKRKKTRKEYKQHHRQQQHIIIIINSLPFTLNSAEKSSSASRARLGSPPAASFFTATGYTCHCCCRRRCVL